MNLINPKMGLRLINNIIETQAKRTVEKYIMVLKFETEEIYFVIEDKKFPYDDSNGTLFSTVKAMAGEKMKDLIVDYLHIEFNKNSDCFLEIYYTSKTGEKLVNKSAL